jgi:hypothetical protein
VDCTVSVQPATVRTAVGLVRLAAALLCTIALVARFVWGLGTVTFTPSNFFAYLTIQSNIGFAVVTAIAGIVALRMPRDPAWMTTARAVVLSCTVSAGVVYAFLVQQAGVRGVPLDVPWSDQVLHFWLPALAIVDWAASPGRGRAHWRTVPSVLGYMLAWGAFTLIRGPIVGWYPYFFLDPSQVSVAEFLLFGGIAFVSFGSLSAGVVALGRILPLLSRLPVKREAAAAEAGAVRRPRRGEGRAGRSR